MNFRKTALAMAFIAFGGSIASGQGTEVAFGGLQHDASLPVEIAADQLQIDQTNGSAIFTGNVLIGQGEMRISAGKVEVLYATEDGSSTGKITKLAATGGVTVVNGTEAAESQRADYLVDESAIVMTGDVILTQGKNALSSDKMTINLDNGSAIMDGRVKTIFQTGDSE